MDNKLSLKLTPTVITSIEQRPVSTHYYNDYSPQLHQSLPDSETIQLIKFGKIKPEMKAVLYSTHRKYRDVFNKDLSNGYNGYFG